MKLLTLVLDDFQDIELVTTLSILQKAEIFSAIDYCNPQGKQEVTGQFGIVRIRPNAGVLNAAQTYDAVFIPGGVGAQHLRSDKPALDLIRQFKAGGKKIFAICDAPNALYEHGIITEENYTSYPLESKQYGHRHPDKECVVDGNFITAKAVLSSYDLGLKIVEIYKDKAAAQALYNAFTGNI